MNEKNKCFTTDSVITSHKEEVGGSNQKCKHILSDISTTLTVEKTDISDIMKELENALKTVKRTEVKMCLNPKTASFIDVGLHAKHRQYLSLSTITKNLRYARFMELHKCPVDFRNLNPENVLRHFDYRIDVEKASAHALAHEKKAIRMFLIAYGTLNPDDKEDCRLWAMVLKTPPVEIKNDVNFVYPMDVHKFYIDNGYSNLKNYKKRIYENSLFQSITFLGFNFGMRCPSEIINLTIDDIKINKDGTGYITIHEQKKHGKNRNIIPHNKNVLSSFAYKTPNNYLVHDRQKVANELSGNAFFLQPNGKPIKIGYVYNHISKVGKRIVGKHFKPNDMRHTFGTFYYQRTKDLLKVSKRLGHTKTSNTEKYVAIAEDLEQQYGKKDLFNLALRPHNNNVGVKPKKQGTFTQPKKRLQVEVNTPEESNGLSRTLLPTLGEITSTQQPKKWVSESSFSSLSLKPFFFFFFCLRFQNYLINKFQTHKALAELYIKSGVSQ